MFHSNNASVPVVKISRWEVQQLDKIHGCCYFSILIFNVWLNHTDITIEHKEGNKMLTSLIVVILLHNGLTGHPTLLSFIHILLNSYLCLRQDSTNILHIFLFLRMFLCRKIVQQAFNLFHFT